MCRPRSTGAKSRRDSRVSSVDDQGQCVAGYAFATAGLLEGQQIPRNFTKLVKLSAQQIVDCSIMFNYGCMGGEVNIAVYFIVKVAGLESDADYPYLGRFEKCKPQDKKRVMTVKDSIDLPENDEEALKKMVAQYGPVATALYVSDEWPYYKSGVYDNIEVCSPLSAPNQWVLVVGYGSDPKEGDYWIIKNFWSDKWGEAGYMRIRRGKQMCAISGYSTIVEFE